MANPASFDRSALETLSTIFGLENWRVQEGWLTADFIKSIPAGKSPDGDHSAAVFAAILKNYGIDSIHRADRMGIAIENSLEMRSAINLLKPEIHELNRKLLFPPQKDDPANASIIRASIIQQYSDYYAALGNSSTPPFFDEGNTTESDKLTLRINYSSYDAAMIMEDSLHQLGIKSAKFVRGRVGNIISPQIALGLDDLNFIPSSTILNAQSLFNERWADRNQSVVNGLNQLHGLEATAPWQHIKDQFVLCAKDLTQARLYTEALQAIGYNAKHVRRKLVDENRQASVQDVVLVDEAKPIEIQNAAWIDRANHKLIESILNTTIPVMDNRAGEWVFAVKDGMRGYQNTSSFSPKYTERYAEIFNRNGIPAAHDETTVFIALDDAKTLKLVGDARIVDVISSVERIVNSGADMPTRHQTVPPPPSPQLRR